MTFLTTLDDVLDRLIIPSFSRLGPAFRRRWFDWQDYDLDGKRVAITGPTSGLGLSATHSFAQRGAELVLLARNPDKVERLRNDVAAQYPDTKIQSVTCDLASLSSVTAATQKIDPAKPLDVLVHNGGGLHRNRQLSDDKIELTLATHVIAPFLLTEKLLPALGRSRNARVITVTSGGMYSQGLNLDDFQTTKNYTGSKAYARAKRAQVTLTRLWAARYPEFGFYSMHPGWVDTPGLQESLPTFYSAVKPGLRSPEQGADTIVWLAGTDSQLPNGTLWLDRRSRPESYRPGTKATDAEAEQLWTNVADLARGGSYLETS